RRIHMDGRRKPCRKPAANPEDWKCDIGGSVLELRAVSAARVQRRAQSRASAEELRAGLVQVAPARRACTRMRVMQKVLVVDDDPGIRDVVCFALQKAGFATMVAADGAQALAKFAADKPALVVLDILMPELDGVEVCRRLRADPKGRATPIVFL